MLYGFVSRVRCAILQCNPLCFIGGACVAVHCQSDGQSSQARTVRTVC